MGIKNAGRPELATRMQISWGTGGSGDHYAHIAIEDQASRLIILEFRLSAEQFGELMSGKSMRGISADFTSYPDRLGKRMEHDTVKLARSTFKDRADAEAATESWRVQAGWDTASVSINNIGEWVLTGRRWVADEQEGS